MKIQYSGWRRYHETYTMIDKSIAESEVKRNNSGPYYPFYYYLDDDLENENSKLKFKAEGLRANGDYAVTIEFSTEELLVLLKSHLANKSFQDIATMLVNLPKDTDKHSSD